MKVIIPVAGAGTRLRPHTYTQPKPLIPVAGKPIIAFTIDALIEVGIKDYVFVIGYLGEKIKDFIVENYQNINVEFVIQEKREGLGHAIWTAHEHFSKEEEILIVLGDIIFDTALEGFIQSTHSCIGVRKVNDPREFGVVELFEKDGFVKKMIEKPKIPKSDLAIVGIYKIKEVKALFEALDFNIKNNIRSYDEFQLTDALDKMTSDGIRFRTIAVDTWFDCGRKDILLETNKALLDKTGYMTSDSPNVEATIIIHPVSIGEGCIIRNSVIGPYVTIGDHSEIEGSIIQNSIVGSYTKLQEISLHESIIGNDSDLKGASQKLNIGDNTAIDFS
jgi:glucose-1-phosphate thymidylyltransferase